MKPETGNNPQYTGRELSIQITLNGFSFYVVDSATSTVIYQNSYCNQDFLTACNYEPYLNQQYDNIYICWSVAQVQAVPKEVFDPSYAEMYMEAINTDLTGSRVLCDDRCSTNSVMVWSADAVLYDLLSEAYPEAMHYHPLGLGFDLKETNFIDIMADGVTAHIKIFDTVGLKVAESAIYHSAEDLLYYIKKLSAGHNSFAVYRLRLALYYGDMLSEFLNAYYPSIEVNELAQFNLISLESV